MSSTQATGAYGAGTAIPITVTFDEPVTVTGTPQLTLNAGSGAVANCTGGSGTSALTFTYTVAAGQNSADLDYVSATALTLNGGSIQDTVGNAAVLTLPAPGTAGDSLATQNITIDTTPPTVTDAHISITSTGSGPGGAYLPGDTVTARWDNSPSGDDNTDALAVTNPVMVDFSQLGGGSVAATQTTPGSKIWTASYTVTGATHRQLAARQFLRPALGALLTVPDGKLVLDHQSRFVRNVVPAIGREADAVAGRVPVHPPERPVQTPHPLLAPRPIAAGRVLEEAIDADVRAAQVIGAAIEHRPLRLGIEGERPHAESRGKRVAGRGHVEPIQERVLRRPQPATLDGHAQLDRLLLAGSHHD